ncbi:MAG TPA: OB-fold nucleic acid binding domain-containing protein, partial [Candidatus Absconditabacterales bacterium]|nr:OB-fold nucleic acid binding domain-containing protein [Candidatus Absconditabacterales bacterium]
MQQKRILIRDLSAHFDQTVMIQGYMHDFRKLGKIAFLIMRDRSGLCQIIVDTPDMINLFDGLYPGSVLEVVGVPILAPGNKQFGMEIQHPIIRIITPCHHVHGIDISKPDLNLDIESMIDNRVVTLRHPKQQAIFKISSIVEKHMRAYFDIHDFTQINSPKLIGFPTEGGAEVFELDYFEKKAYLAQSPQFYKQMMVPVFERVY